MANSRINPDSFYVNGNALPASFYQAIDLAQFQAVNGYSGGTWTPSTPWQIGGAGIWLCGPTNSTTSGSIITTLSASGKRIVLASNDVPLINSSRPEASRTIVTSCGVFQDNSNGIAQVASYSARSYPAGDSVNATGAGCRIHVPVRVHDGAVFYSATLSVVIGSGHQAIPAILPKWRILAVDVAGNVTPLIGTALIPGGWTTMSTPGSVGAYNGSTSTIGYNVNAFMPDTIVDRSSYCYIAEIVDESGAGAIPGNAYTGISCSFTEIGDMRFS